MRVIAQSTTPTVCFLMVDSTDHVSGKTGLTITVKLSKNGGTSATSTNSASQIDSTNLPGWYSLVLTATETDTIGDLILRATATGADQSDRLFAIESADLTNIDTEVDNIQTIVSSNLDVAVSSRLSSSDSRLNNLNAPVGSIPTNPLLTTDSRLNNIDATISSRLATSGYTTPPTVLQIDTQLTSSHGSGAWGNMYPTAITYSEGGVINTVTWSTGKVWTYHYTGTDLTSITEA